MEGDNHNPKKLGTARAGLLAASLLGILLLALPAAWYAAYHDQLAPPAARSVPFLASPPSRPSGVVLMGPPKPGQTLTVQIQHTGGQVITTINGGDLQIKARATDPCPPSNPLDALGQSLCDRYNAWKCEKGDPYQVPNGFMGTGMGTGTMTIEENLPPSPPPPPAHASGTRAPGLIPRPAAHTPARP